MIDTSDAVVRQLKRVLELLPQSLDSAERGSVLFISSKNEASLLAMSKDLLTSDLNLHAINSASLGEVS